MRDKSRKAAEKIAKARRKRISEERRKREEE